MSDMQRVEGDEEVVQLTHRVLMPVVQRFGDREIEVTFLGKNSTGQPTWVLWNPMEPHLIGMLREGQFGYTLEQRTDQGVMLHENLSLRRVQRAIAQ